MCVFPQSNNVFQLVAPHAFLSCSQKNSKCYNYLSGNTTTTGIKQKNAVTMEAEKYDKD